MIDLIREFPCFAGFVILALLGLGYTVVMAIENVAIARIKVRGLVDLEKREKGR